MNQKMKHRTLNFPVWKDPDGTVHDRIITFHNDGQFTTNTETYHKVPQNETQFNQTIDVYIQSGEAKELFLS